MLLKTAVDIKKYNKNAPSKKPGLRKTVLFITLENTVHETVERMFNMTVSTEALKEYTPAQALDMIKKEGSFKIEGDDDINIIIKYFPINGIDTDDLYTIIEDLEDEGFETIALILDYIKRIRPALYAKEEKEQLKNVTNELKNLAIELDIPVISAHQSGAFTQRCVSKNSFNCWDLFQREDNQQRSPMFMIGNVQRLSRKGVGLK